jgi:hypothetical protein
VETYIRSSVAAWVSPHDSIPQTVDDVNACIHTIRQLGIMGPTGVAEVTLTQFYNFNTDNILNELSANVLDDIYEIVDLYIIQSNYLEPYDRTDIDQVCELYVSYYLETYIDDLTEFVQSYSETIIDDNRDLQQ